MLCNIILFSLFPHNLYLVSSIHFLLIFQIRGSLNSLSVSLSLPAAPLSVLSTLPPPPAMTSVAVTGPELGAGMGTGASAGDGDLAARLARLKNMERQQR